MNTKEIIIKESPFKLAYLYWSLQKNEYHRFDWWSPYCWTASFGYFRNKLWFLSIKLPYLKTKKIKKKTQFYQKPQKKQETV